MRDGTETNIVLPKIDTVTTTKTTGVIVLRYIRLADVMGTLTGLALARAASTYEPDGRNVAERLKNAPFRTKP